MAGMAALSYAPREVAQQLRGMAEQLERGQAETPLVDQAESLLGLPDSAVSVVLLGLEPAARAAALAWLVGPQHHSVTIRLSEPLDTLEVRLQERGYSLETDSQGRSEFDSAARLAAALEALGSASPDLAAPIRLALAAPPALRNLHLVVMRDAATVRRSPAILGSLVNRAPILLVAATGEYRPTPDDLEAIPMLAGCVAGIWPLIVGPAPAAAPIWLRPLAATGLTLLPVHVLGEGGSFLPDFIARGPNHPIRQALSGMALAQRGSSLIDMIQERFETDLRQLQSRQKREARLERAADGAAREQDVKLLFDRYKLQLNDEFNKLMQSLREGNRRALLKSGEIAQVLEQLLASLQATDLDRETSSKTIRLSLKTEVLADFRRRLSKALRYQLDEECVLIRDSLEETRRGAEALLAESGAVNRSLALTPPDNRALWEPLAEMLDLDIKYRGEIPRRGFMQRLGEGRRIVFVGMMALSLVGSFVGFNVRQAAWAGVAFLMLFLGAVAYTYRTWQHEEEESFGKEIERVRESVAAEFNRVLNDILREKQSRLQQALDEIKRQAVTRLDAALREAQLGKAQATESERRDARAKLKLIEQRLRELQGLGQQVGKLRQQVGEWVEQAREALRRSAADSREAGA